MSAKGSQPPSLDQRPEPFRHRRAAALGDGHGLAPLRHRRLLVLPLLLIHFLDR